MVSVSQAEARRFVLGRQGLWPGRRWKGRGSVERALRYIGSVQYDPVDVVGRSHDLALWGRVVDYRPEALERALYRTRSVFETGGNVQIVPIEELPYLRIAFERKAAGDRWRRFAEKSASELAVVRRELERRGPLGPSDFRGPGERRIENYRARRGSGLALYYLWLRGEVMIARRRRGEKVFDLTPRLLRRPAPDVPVATAEDHLILGTLRQLGLASGPEWLAYAHARIGRPSLRTEWAERLRRWQAQGEIAEVEVDGWAGRRWLVGDGATDLESIRRSNVPAAWRPVATSTDEEVLFLSPLEWVSARGRAASLFDFEYIWEAYKPAAKRRWGYYTLPVLWDDLLVARIELRVERTGDGLLRVLGFWPEAPSVPRDRRFATALGRGLARLGRLNGTTRLDAARLGGPSFRTRVAAGFRLPAT